MRKWKIIILLITSMTIMQYSNIAYCQEFESPDYASLLKEAMQKYDYQTGSQYLPYLEYSDSLSLASMMDIADCYIGLQKYEQCIRFCDRCVRKHPDDGYEDLLDDKYGEAYYYSQKYELAAKYLGHYVDWADNYGYKVGAYYLGLYSESLFESRDYKKAYIYFERYFSKAAEDESLTVETLYRSKYSKSHGYKFYDYGFTSFYLGEEVKGKKMLELASRCGNEYAKKDLEVLNKCYTFASDFDIKSRYIYEWDELIAKYDIKHKVAGLDNSNPKVFWDALQMASPDYLALTEALSKERRQKTLEKAVSEINSSKAGMKYRLSLCSPYKKGEIEEGLESQLYGRISPVSDFRIYPSSDINAFATPYGQIYLTEGIVDRYHFNNNLLLGVCAHESTHFLCQHSLSSLWQAAEKERKNEIWGGIAAGLSAIAMAGAGMYAAANGVSFDQDYWDNTAKISVGLMEAFAQDAYLFKFKYSRNQEIESDIIAYRFCEWMGLSGYSYIMALQLLGDDDVYLKSDSTSDHPTTLYRVLLLKHMFNKDREAEVQARYEQKILNLYNAMTSEGIDTGGSIEKFKSNLRKDSKLRAYYDALVEANYDMGTYESFVEKIRERK